MNRLKELRKEKKLTQKELADKINVSKLTISRWERGERVPKSDKAQALADFFGVNTAYLLGYLDFPARSLREILFHEIKAEKEYKVIRIGDENFISENRVLNIIDKYVSRTTKKASQKVCVGLTGRHVKNFSGHKPYTHTFKCVRF